MYVSATCGMQDDVVFEVNAVGWAPSGARTALSLHREDDPARLPAAAAVGHAHEPTGRYVLVAGRAGEGDGSGGGSRGGWGWRSGQRRRQERAGAGGGCAAEEEAGGGGSRGGQVGEASDGDKVELGLGLGLCCFDGPFVQL